MRKNARLILEAAIGSVIPSALIPRFISLDNNILKIGEKQFSIETTNDIYVIAAGKAAAAMALEVEKILGNKISGGVVVTKYEHVLPLQFLECVEAGHPLPDHNGLIAAEKVQIIADGAKENDLVIFLLSGGASALLADPPHGIHLEDMIQFSQQLLHSGADIHEINTIRKHLSVLKGGQLVRYVWPAKLVCLAVSDVTGDDSAIIGSGPTVADNSTFEDAWRIIGKYRLEDKAPDRIVDYLLKGRNGLVKDTPDSTDPIFANSYFYLIGNNTVALKSGGERAAELGYHFEIVTEQFGGDVEKEAKRFFSIARDLPGLRPACYLAGGESTVTVKGKGKGGRNQHMALAFLNEWIKHKAVLPGLLFLSSATDGTDGPTTAAGAMVDQEFANDVIDQPKHLADCLANNDSWHFFENSDMHIITGPTQTNVMDIVLILVNE